MIGEKWNQKSLPKNKGHFHCEVGSAKSCGVKALIHKNFSPKADWATEDYKKW